LYFFKKIKFEKLEVVLRLYKKMGKSRNDVLSLFSQDENRLFINVRYDDLPVMTVNDALALQNAEQRMIALTVFTPEEFIADINAELIDEQTIAKSHIRWDDQLKPYQRSFVDTYSLYKISAFELGLENIARTASVFFVKCKCTSTHKVYYLYVPEAVGNSADALAAIAWTYRFNGKPLTKEQYLNLIYTET
jgi:hypothetical protein